MKGMAEVAYYEFFWTDEIIIHIAENGVTPEEFEQIVKFPELRGNSRNTGRPCCWGETADGRWVICVYEEIDDVTILPISAYEVPTEGQESSS